MKIEIAEPGRMTQTGSSLLKLIQNNKTPVLDLLVRESVQNSLDARKLTSKFVNVEFLTGKFSCKELSKEFEGISEPLTERFGYKSYSYIAIRDSETTGLTGEMDYRKVTDNNYGNLLKLVYEICKPQEAEGAGGSWGLGKTVYFRIGIGLVVYYSRIKTGRKYESRLAASLVENEAAYGSIIPSYKNLAKRGIAWWGKSAGINNTVPVTDEDYIREFLEIFGIKPYTGEETGTTIIIPFTDNQKLLDNNRIDIADDNEFHETPFWYSSVEDYLKIAVQRWYAPRLNNSSYSHGAFLRVSINNEPLTNEAMEPVFRVVQELYNKAKHVKRDYYLDENNAEVFVGEAKINKYLTDSNAGNIACTKISKDVLKMTAPFNKPSPSLYFNCEGNDKNANRPAVFYCRKPGMIVSYEYLSAWTSGIPSTNQNDYIFGIFVLNSDDKFKIDNCPVSGLEEYVRRSEMADHTSWNDWSESSFNPRIITKIQNNVTKAIGNQYAEEDITHQPHENSELSRLFGDLLLPPDGFGSGANRNPITPKNPKTTASKKKSTFSADTDNIIYSDDNMIVPLNLKTSSNKKIRKAGFEIQIDSESGKISVAEWENKLLQHSPFSITELRINISTSEGKKTDINISLSKNNRSENVNGQIFTLKETAEGTFYGLDMESEAEKSVTIHFTAMVHLTRRDVRPAFIFEKE